MSCSCILSRELHSIVHHISRLIVCRVPEVWGENQPAVYNTSAITALRGCRAGAPGFVVHMGPGTHRGAQDVPNYFRRSRRSGTRSQRRTVAARSVPAGERSPMLPHGIAWHHVPKCGPHAPRRTPRRRTPAHAPRRCVLVCAPPCKGAGPPLVIPWCTLSTTPCPRPWTSNRTMSDSCSGIRPRRKSREAESLYLGRALTIPHPRARAVP